MKKTERLNGIVYTLKERGKMTASQLAEHFEVSLRTIYRDIDALSQLKVPIVTYDGVHGGYEIDMDYFIPSISLTEQEVIMLLIVLNYGETIKLPDLAADYQLLRGKLINSLTDVDQKKITKLMSYIEFGSHRIEPSDYKPNILIPVLESFMEERNLRIAYYNPSRDDTSYRNISPTCLFFSEGGWYLTAFCHKRLEKRVFRLDRIRSIEVLNEPNVYLGKPITSASDKFVGTDYLLTIRESKFRVLKENDYFSTAVVLNTSLDSCMAQKLDPVLTIAFNTIYQDDIANIVLKYPESITVIEPESFRQKIEDVVLKLSQKYL